MNNPAPHLGARNLHSRRTDGAKDQHAAASAERVHSIDDVRRQCRTDSYSNAAVVIGNGVQIVAASAGQRFAPVVVGMQ